MVYKQFMCDWEKMSQANHAIFSRLICINLPHNFLQLTFFYTQNFVCKNLQYLSPFNSVHLIFRLLHLYTAVLFNSYPTLGGNLGCAYIQNASISTLLKKTSLKPLVQHSIVYIFLPYNHPANPFSHIYYYCLVTALCTTGGDQE